MWIVQLTFKSAQTCDQPKKDQKCFISCTAKTNLYFLLLNSPWIAIILVSTIIDSFYNEFQVHRII